MDPEIAQDAPTDGPALVCCKCRVELRPERATFSYLGHHFFAEVLRCPVCKQVYIPEELARGKMAEVEMELEDK